jgi:hypothetical protein
MLSVLTDCIAGGLFPSFSDLFTQLPSLSAVVRRAPDTENKLDDGSTRVTYKGVTQADFDSFSRYIGQYGCEVVSYTNQNGVFKAELRYSDAVFTFEYDSAGGQAVLVYPAGTSQEVVELPTATPAPTVSITRAPTRTPTATPRKTATPRPTATPKKGIHMEVLDTDATGYHRISSKRMGIQVKVKNNHPYKTVRDYVMVSYTCGEFNDRNSADNEIRFVKEVKPYETAETPDIPLLNKHEDIYYIYIAIKSVRYTDGTTETDDDPEFHVWTVNHR